MLYLIILLFIQAITALHTPHSKSESPLLPDASRTIVGARLDLNQTLTPSLNFFQENEILQKLTSSTETGNILLAIPRKSIQKKALSMSQWSLGPIHGISTELVEMKIPKSHKNDDIRSQRKPTSKEALSICLWSLEPIHGTSTELIEMKISKSQRRNNDRNPGGGQASCGAGVRT
ncbi:hypothetical protein KEM48_004626 [Puccinia striiformis f. sp. tritici PST-130]|nr:hypothetical protein KEM48_004626 [Puccinia striiformis f. sp. tritici PST-130]